MADSREFWSVGEFARAHGISPRWVYKLLERGELHAVKIGSRTLISDASRQRWLAGLRNFVPGGV
jgi:excisionase family DNA binding protein